MGKFAVIDIETNLKNEVMSIGMVVSDEIVRKPMYAYYYKITPACESSALFSYCLDMPGIEKMKTGTYNDIIKEIQGILEKNDIKKILAYNAKFDKQHLPELKDYQWADIMSLAAYRQYNKKISDDIECFSTGRMKKGYSVEGILRMIGDNKFYFEKHNAYYDAVDELKIVELLGYSIDTYKII